MPFFTMDIPVVEKASFDKTAQFQPALDKFQVEDNYTLLVDTERMQQALDSGFVKMPNEVQGKAQIHEFLLNAGKIPHGV